jgi:hypothetical protein
MATYNEVLAKIAASDKEDWIMKDDETERTYKGDLNIRIVNDAEEALFNEPWVQRLGHVRPKRQKFTIYYGNSFVGTVQTVAVAGSRAYIPFPKSGDELVISYWEYRFAQIIQPPVDRLDFYLQQASIRVGRG